MGLLQLHSCIDKVDGGQEFEAERHVGTGSAKS